MLYYLDDFIIIGSPDTGDCQWFVEIMDIERAVLGIPVAEHKKEGLTTRLTFLGKEIDTVQGIMRLPPRRWNGLGFCRMSGRNARHAPGKSWSQ